MKAIYDMKDASEGTLRNKHLSVSSSFCISMQEMQKWLINYERMRHSKKPKEPNESWVSSKYDIQNMSWKEISEIYLPEIDMRFGSACSALKKLWKSYKIAGRSESREAILHGKLIAYNLPLGIERSQFPELEGMNDDEDQELTDEELELKKEEEEESSGVWEPSLNFGTSEKRSEAILKSGLRRTNSC